MRILHPLCLTFVSTQALSFPIGQTTNATSFANSTDLTAAYSLGTNIDRRFGIGFTSVPARLNGLSTYMNILNYLTVEAQENFLGTLPQEPPATSLPAPYDNVRIEIKSANEQRIQRRFLVWGLYLALNHFSAKGFFWTAFQLEWNGEKVAALFFESKTENQLPSAANNSTTEYNNSALAGSDITLGDPVVYVDIQYEARGQTLSIAGVFIAMSAIVIELAGRSSGAKLRPFVSQDRDHRINFGFNYQEAQRSSPVINNAQTCQAVWQTANFLVDNRRYAEFSGSITLNGRYAASMLMLDFDTPRNSA